MYEDLASEILIWDDSEEVTFRATLLGGHASSLEVNPKQQQCTNSILFPTRSFALDTTTMRWNFLLFLSLTWQTFYNQLHQLRLIHSIN